MALSDQLEALAGKTKKLEETAATIRAKNVAKLEQQREQMHAAMEAQKEQVRAKTAQTRSETQDWWAGVTAGLEKRRAQAKANFAEQKAKWAAGDAESQAEAAEDYASFIATVSSDLIDEAAYSALDAAALRERADAMKKETVKTGS